MDGIIGFWKWLAASRAATPGTTLALLESGADSGADEVGFGEQLLRLNQSLEEANALAKVNSRGGPRHGLARAAGSGVVRPV